MPVQIQGIKLPDPLKNAMMAETIRNYQSQNALNQMRMDAAKKKLTDEDTLNELYKSAYTPETGLDQNKLLGAAAQRGMGSSIPALTKSFAESEKLKNEASREFDKSVGERMKNSRMELETVTTPQEYLEWHIRNHEDPVLSKYFAGRGVSKENSLGQIVNAINSGKFNELLNASKVGLEKSMQNHFATLDSGDTVNLVSAPSYGTGPTTVAASYVKGMSPDQVSREKIRTAKIDDANDPSVVARTVTDSAGNVTQLNKFGQPVGTPLKNAGKPSATFEKIQAQRKQLMLDLDSAIGDLEEVTKDGGLIDQSTGSGAGALVDSVAGFVGHPTKGAIAVGRLAPIYDKVLKMVPRFEGPQSNQDTISYNKAAGDLANPKTPDDIKKSSAKEILRLMKARKGQFLTRDIIDAGGGVTDTSGVTPPPNVPPGKTANVNLNESIDAGLQKQVVRTGTMNGHKVVQYSDGTVDYAD